MPTRLPLTLITSSDLPWKVYAPSFPAARATSPCTNPPALAGQYVAAYLAKSPRQLGSFTDSGEPKTVSARDGYGPVMTTSEDSGSSATDTHGRGHARVSGALSDISRRTSRLNTIPPCSVAQYELMKFRVTCACAYRCTSTLTGSAQNVAHRSDDVSMASIFAALLGSVMSWRTTAEPVLRIEHRSAATVVNILVGAGYTGDPTIITDRTAASRGPMSMYDCPVIHPEEPTVSMPPETPSAPSPGTHANTEDIVADTPETYPPWPCTTPLGLPVLPLVYEMKSGWSLAQGRHGASLWAATSALASVMAAHRARSLARADHGRGAWKGTSGAARRSFAAQSIGTPPWRTGAS